MNFRQLETFYWISKLGTFAAAAEKLHATQSTVSARVAELEQSLGQKLFEKFGRKARLTSRGTTLLPLAEQAMSLAAEIERLMDAHQAVRGKLRLGAGEIAAISWLPMAADRFRQQYPGIELEVTVDVTIVLHQLLKEGKLDLVVGVGSVEDPTVSCVSIGHVDMRWTASRALALGRVMPLVTEVIRSPILTLAKDSHLHVSMQQWLVERGADQAVVHASNNIGTLIALARAGLGVAVLPTCLIERELAAGELELLELQPPVDRYEFFLAARVTPKSPAINAFWALGNSMKMPPGSIE